ncbi:DNA topoisomerase III [Conservatibacter flavescens]|uniref:DNA topoisomerase n=1 Tax=Conservatibacter flavescens TaxID=28161 RepID=A0A2M8S103_9PAST|nr:DNA topoisomerase III [Conservatibacter flavescens]PJG84784.1 DNA topoisomerase III [Conservatibacter flavescens]
MKLYLCEKPSQARDIAKLLGATQKGEGCLLTPDGHTVVTWARGHLVEQFSPEQYDSIFKEWRLDTLPIIPSQWQVYPKVDTKKEYKAVTSLLKKAKSVVISTDIDREGETIAREILDMVGYKGPIQRLWINALDEPSIRKALSQLKTNEETISLYYAGLARSRADWLIGMNFSRMFTLLAQQKGYQGPPLSVGRVQSPTLALVVNRDKEIANFTPKSHYALTVQVTTSNLEQFGATLIVPEQYCDEDGRCLDMSVIQKADTSIRQSGQVQVKNIETKREKEGPPLLFALSDLQSECNRLYDLGTQQVLDIAQSLYEKHKATTYPRTDCGYLPESQLLEVPQVIESVIKADNALSSIYSELNLSQKSRAWNDKKITAHHGIIPTTACVDISKMDENEFKVYDLIRRRYLAQFLPHFETDKTMITLSSRGQNLVAKGQVIIASGWKILFSKSAQEDNADKQKLPIVTEGQTLKVVNTEVKSLKTSPPSHYTEGTLVTAMVNVARFVTDERLKKQLRETEGLGTEATRANILETLYKRGYIKKKGKSIIATPAGVMLIDNLPTALKDPGLTALWEQALNNIAENRMTLSEFMQKQEQFIRHLIQNCGHQGLNMKNIEIKKCPQCSKPLRKIKGEKGEFWGCTGYPNCKCVESMTKKKSANKKSSVNLAQQFANLHQIIK